MHFANVKLRQILPRVGKIWVSTPRCTSHLGFLLGVFLLGVFDRVFLRISADCLGISADFFKYAAKIALLPTGGFVVGRFIARSNITEFKNLIFRQPHRTSPGNYRIKFYTLNVTARELGEPQPGTTMLHLPAGPPATMTNKSSAEYWCVVSAI